MLYDTCAIIYTICWVEFQMIPCKHGLNKFDFICLIWRPLKDLNLQKLDCFVDLHELSSPGFLILALIFSFYADKCPSFSLAVICPKRVKAKWINSSLFWGTSVSKSNQRNGERHRDLLYSVIWSAFVEIQKKILHPLHSIKRLFLKRIWKNNSIVSYAWL